MLKQSKHVKFTDYINCIELANDKLLGKAFCALFNQV